MIKIVDYGLGNITAFSNMYRRMNIPVETANTAEQLEGADSIILPGVGAFDRAIELLNESRMRATLERMVCEDQVPVLGVCVGMQILANSSDEGKLPGLGWMPGRIRAFKTEPSAAELPSPHMGWNDVTLTVENSLFKGLESEARFYFLHSYFFECEQDGSSVTTSNYGLNFTSSVCSGNVYGVQFHPEKSHHYGSMLLKNFAEL